MPTLAINDTELFYRDVGAGDETIVFAHGLLFDHRQYQHQIEKLRGEYRCIVYDHRGQGQSGPSRAPMVDMETLYLDAAELIERFGVGPCHFVGLSMGGFVGLRLAARRPDLVKSLVLADTRAGREPPENVPQYERLNMVAKWLGVGLVADRVLPLMFSERFLDSDSPEVREARETWRERLEARDKSVHKAVRGVLHRPSVEGELDRIEAPTLVVHGEDDRAISIDEGRQLADAIDGAAFLSFSDTGHLSSIERPERFTRAIADFLSDM